MTKLQTSEELEQLIDKALKKIQGDQENDICKFLPMDGGYMHHFTLRKMKHEDPIELKNLISTYILQPEAPKRVPHKPRRPRGSRKRHDVIALTRTELERVLLHCRDAGDNDIAVKLSPKKSLAQAKRQLIASVKRNSVEPELWSAYLEAVGSRTSPLHPAQLTPGHVLLTANPEA
ncbi:MAG: hypothetical protein JSR80_08345 [Verrucomicrobia bacterium]|nr:hypothetical protein [Verrucomicrobiota bacterium]